MAAAPDAQFKEIGDRLARLRTTNGMNQTEFANLLGIKVNRYNQYENGKRKPPTDIAGIIRSRTGAPMDWLYEGASENLPLRLADLAKPAPSQGGPQRGRPPKTAAS